MFCLVSWEGGKGYGIVTFSIDRLLNKEHFYGKIMEKMCTKSESQTPFKFLWVTKKPKIATTWKKLFWKLRYIERGL